MNGNAHHLSRSFKHWLGGIGLVGLLSISGCASVYRVDTQVDTHTAWQHVKLPQTGDTYHLEKLPSQTNGPGAAHAEHMDRWLATALAPHGLAPAQPAQAATTHWLVQVRTREVLQHQPPGDRWRDPWGWQMGVGGVSGNVGVGVRFPVWHLATPLYVRELELLIRHPASGRVVFESMARHDGPWNGEAALWTAMLEAALQGFPTPPTGPRWVIKDLPRH